MTSLLFLKPNQRFSIVGTDISGTLVGVNDCRALVKLDRGMKMVDFEDAEGYRHAFKTATSRMVSISPGTEVTPGEVLPVVTAPASATMLAEKSARGAKAKKPSANPTGLCLCGCGLRVANRFSVGHDSRFHSRVRKLQDGSLSMAELKKALGKAGSYAISFYEAAKTDHDT